MHIIMLSGGSGKRLWPLSNDSRSKQFIKILKNDNGNLESMLQRVHRQIKEVGGWDSITVAAGAAQIEQLRLQLDEEVNIVIEPSRRDTFPAIALACAYLFSEKNISRDEMICIIPVDPYVDVEYFEAISKMDNEFFSKDLDIILLGIEPSFPSEKYGYMVPDEFGKISRFKEKPDKEMAEKLIEDGALWNCGVFGLKLGYILDLLKEKYDITNFQFEEVKRNFDLLQKTSFDYEVLEKANKVGYIEYKGKWKDLGTWEALSEEMDGETIGNILRDKNCENVHAINELNLPLVLMGIKDTVVVASSEGILVTDKNQSYNLKEVVGNICMRPMYEEKRWGTYTVLDYSKDDKGQEILTKKLIIKKGNQISYQYHSFRKELWNIVKGEGVLYIEGEKKNVKAGEVVNIKENEKHGIYAASELVIIEVQIGKPLIEEDIIRLEYDWKV